MRLPFHLRGMDGTVAIEVVPNDDPEALGCRFPGGARDLATCTAVIEHPGRGYVGLMGWVQLVSSTDGESGEDGFDPDPLGFYGDLNVPYGFFGIRPTLFDGPSRDTRDDLVWVAHSFLCYSPDLATRTVCAVTGFSWGFTIRSGQVKIQGPEKLPAGDWDRHGARLSGAYPGWEFALGYRTG
ncbi:hypothetical protein [Nonomuraea jabiensis]|uniref:Uncharacterized protein n=1 Tax=Nonomuraea jabiensis TaxID=882448 RepID=A0A7W9LEF0_9ACTN|nr:hypothetical protein [Nonomuraea jabiensis]MBB5780776.1 hypothetical protein [Nonomuraea jabiensis]